MRTLAWLLLITAAAVAQDNFPRALATFEKARKRTLEPGAHAVMNPAVEQLAATDDYRAVFPLASCLVQTFADVAHMFDAAKASQRRGARAYERRAVLEKEIEHLQLKLDAGDRSAGPAIEKRVFERRKVNTIFSSTKEELAGFIRQIEKIRELRELLAESIIGLLRKLDGKELEAALVGLREVFDVADKDQGLFLVRILRDCGRPEAEEHLIALLAHPKATMGVRATACLAVARYRTKRGCLVLLQLGERDEALRPTVLHALGLAAHKLLPDLAAARAWVDTLS